jgi:hypothetical protein
MHDVTPGPRSPESRATFLGAFAALPLLVWWAGWAPAIMSSDSIDQWNQALTFDFVNSHPIAHTASLWVIASVWASPAAVTLVHVVATALVLAVVARRLVQIGVIVPLAVAAVWLIAILPMTGAMTVTIWKDVPFSLAMLWVAAELMLMARDRTAFWTSWWGPGRLGLALGIMWAFRANGRLTALAFAIALAIGFRSAWKGLLAMAGAMIVVGSLIPMALMATLPVVDQPIEPAQVFMPDVAAVVVHDRDALSASDLALVEAVAPLSVYDELYACGDSTPLLFSPGYDNQVIRDDPGAYRGLVVRAALASPMTVLGHRWCAGEYLLSPFNRTGTFVHRPPFDIWPNTLGLARDPVSDRAYDITLWMYKAAEQSEIEWLTWRPAISVLAALVTYGFVAWRRRLRPLLWVAGFFVLHLLNVLATSPAHEFRYAYGLYLISLASLPWWYLIADPSRAALGGAAPDSTAVGGASPSADEPRGDADRQPEQGDDDHVRVADQVPAGDPVDDQEHQR